MTYAHTLKFYKIQNLKTKDQTIFSSFWFLQVLIFQNWQKPVDRSGRPTCTSVQVCTLADRPGRPGSVQYSLFVAVDPGGRPTSLNGQKYDRWRSTGPVDRQLSEKSDRLQQLYFFDSFVGISTQRLSPPVLPCFSTPINRRSLQHDKTTIFTRDFHKFSSLSFWEKIF